MSSALYLKKLKKTKRKVSYIMYKMFIYKNRHLCFHFVIGLFLFSVTIPKLTMRSFSCVFFYVKLYTH